MGLACLGLLGVMRVFSFFPPLSLSLLTSKSPAVFSYPSDNDFDPIIQLPPFLSPVDTLPSAALGSHYHFLCSK